MTNDQAPMTNPSPAEGDSVHWSFEHWSFAFPIAAESGMQRYVEIVFDCLPLRSICA